MSARRADLLELTPQALAALTNAGFVKRAQKDLAAGDLPTVEEGADGSIVACYADGHCATLPAGHGLGGARCSCPASGMCRHRVTLVLAYQRLAAATEQTAAASACGLRWTPACFAAGLDAVASARVLAEATRLAAQRPVVRLSAWQGAAPVPLARLPLCSVRFFARGSLAHAHCDCMADGMCAHIVLAVWAFAQAEAAQPGFAEMSIVLAGPGAQPATATAPASHIPATALAGPQASATLRSQIQALLHQLWQLGASQPLLALEAAFAQILCGADCLGWCWVGETVREIREQIAARHARSTRFDPQRLLTAMAGLDARLTAAEDAQQQAERGESPRLPACQILGQGVAGEVRLDHVRLFSLGAQVWSDEAADGTEGARLIFADPATAAVTVVERSWSKAVADGAARRMGGQTLARLASSQVVSNRAKRRANGRIELPTAARSLSVLQLAPGAWDSLQPPLRQPDAAALRRHLLGALPDFVRPVQAIEHMYVLPVTRVAGVAWDAARQVLHAQLQIGAAGPGDTVGLMKPHNPAAPDAVDALAATLAGEHGSVAAVAGVVRLAGAATLIEPFALLTSERAVVPDMAALGAHRGAHRVAPGIVRDDTAPLVALADRAHALLAQWLRRGLRNLAASDLEQGETLAQHLDRNGLGAAARLLRSALAGQALAGHASADNERPPLALNKLCLLLIEIARNA